MHVIPITSLQNRHLKPLISGVHAARLNTARPQFTPQGPNLPVTK